MVKSLILIIALIQKIRVLIEHCICIHSFEWEEIGDVLHGLGEDRGWTSKPDFVWGWTPLAPLYVCLLILEVFLHVVDTALKCVSIGKYGSVLV